MMLIACHRVRGSSLDRVNGKHGVHADVSSSLCEASCDVYALDDIAVRSYELAVLFAVQSFTHLQRDHQHHQTGARG